MSELSVVATPSTESLRHLVLSSPDGIVVLDRRGVVLLANPVAEQMLRPLGAGLVGTEFGDPAEDLSTLHSSATGRTLEMRVSRIDWEGRPARLVELRDVTARRTADQIADRTRVLLNEAERVAGLGSWEADLATGKVVVSAGGLRLLGLADIDQVERVEALLDFVHPDDRRRIAEQLELVHRTGQSSDTDYRLVRADGEVRIMHTTFAREARDEPGRPRRLRGITQDVTETRDAEQAHRETFRLLEAIAENTVAAVFVKDLDGRFLFSNSRHAELYGRTREQMVGLTAFDLLPAEIAAAIHEHERKILAEGVASTREQRVELPDGTQADWLSVHFPIRLEDGRPFALGAVGFDVTEQRRAVEALRESEQRFRLLADNSQDVIFLLRLRPEPVMECISPAVERVLGIPPGAAHDLEGVRANFDPADVAVLAEDLRSPDFRPRVAPFHRPDGSVVWLERRAVTVRDEAGRATALEGTLRDVSDMVIAEQEQQRLARQLGHAERLDALGRLAGGVAHDFNNLLAVIMGNAEFLIDDFDEDDPRRAEIEEIMQAAQQGAALTRQLLIFSRREPSRPEVLDLDQFITALADLLRRTVGAEIELVVRRAPEPPMVYIDPAKLEQVLINLALNARAAIGGVGTLTVETAEVQITESEHPPPALAGDLPVAAGRYVRLTVADTGCGMTPEVAGRAFEPFFTTWERDEGSGLGLTTAHGILKEAGGHIALDSRPGGGATFQIHLPVAQAAVQASAQAAAAAAVTAGSGSGTSPQGRGETVLVVEDEDPVRDVVTRVLTRSGYQVLTAADAAQALEICADPDTVIDLLLTDVIMPGMTGGQLAERLQDSERAGLPVLFMSGYVAGQRPIDPALKPEVPVLHKPFDADTLLHRIRETLGPPAATGPD